MRTGFSIPGAVRTVGLSSGQSFRSRVRRANQRGNEILEFAIISLVFAPLIVGTFVTGMNVVRSIAANQIARDLASMYIHGGDFSTYNMQQVAQRLSSGMNMVIGSSFTGNQSDNTGNSTGQALVAISQLVWVGSNTDPQCVAVTAVNCINRSSFVFRQHIRFGNQALASEAPDMLVAPVAARANTGDLIGNPASTTGAQLATAQQTAYQAIWQTVTGGQTALIDGQAIYMAEVYFQSPDLSVGSLGGQGVYARWFF